jgi:hypothetical protein
MNRTLNPPCRPGNVLAPNFAGAAMRSGRSDPGARNARIDLEPIDSTRSGDLTILRFRVLKEPDSHQAYHAALCAHLKSGNCLDSY